MTDKRWAKEARSHRQALKKAGPPPNLFMSRLSRQSGVSRPSTRGPWGVLFLLVAAIGAAYWAYTRYYTLHPTEPIVNSQAPLPSQDGPVTISTSTEPSIPTVTPQPPVVVAKPVVPVAPVIAVLQTETVVPRVIEPDSREWRGAISSIKESRTVILRGRTAWRTLWTEMGNADEAPRVNFTDYVVVGIFAGPRVPGSDVSLRDPRVTEQSVIVSYQIAEPSAAASEPIYPYHLRILVHGEKTVRLVQESTKP